jgi:quercetin dioxygenase-like cupin family protein
MNSFRKTLIALLLTVSLALLGNPAASSGDYDGLKVSPIKKTTTTTNGRKIAYPQTDSPEVTVVTVDISPNTETGWHVHSIPVYAYVLAGELIVHFEDGKQHIFREGDAIIEVVNTPHNGRNHGNVPVKLVVFYTGVEGRPNTEKIQRK